VATNDDTVWHIRVACWISKAPHSRAPTLARAHTHTDRYVILIAFPRQQCLPKAPRLYVIRTLPVLYFNKIVPKFLKFCDLITAVCFLVCYFIYV
jgi:hypothetical protein